MLIGMGNRERVGGGRRSATHWLVSRWLARWPRPLQASGPPNEPGVQVYSGNFQGIGNEPNIKHKGGVYPQHVSICLESQKYPDSPNKKDWVQPLLNPGEKYYSHAAYKFSVK